MLAYFFLWNGQDIPKPTAKTHLDKMVEDYVQGKMKQVRKLESSLCTSCLLVLARACLLLHLTAKQRRSRPPGGGGVQLPTLEAPCKSRAMIKQH